jgi:hypothetical protein
VDPVSLIVGALAAGASKGVTETATTAVKDAYALLRRLVGRLFQGRPVAEAVLNEHAKDPDGPYQDTLKAELNRAGAGADPQLVAAARELLEAVDPDGARSGKYALDLRGAQVGSVGDHNTNTITFGTPPPAQP